MLAGVWLCGSEVRGELGHVLLAIAQNLKDAQALRLREYPEPFGDELQRLGGKISVSWFRSHGPQDNPLSTYMTMSIYSVSEFSNTAPEV